MDFLDTGFKAPSLADFSPASFRGDTPPRRDLIAGRLPRGKVVLLAGEGDVGKSWLLLQLFEAINGNANDYAFGGRVVQTGRPSLMLFGEDDRGSTDLRLKAIRAASRPCEIEYGAILPAPDLGHMALVKRDYDGSIKPTDVFGWLDKQLDNLKAWGELGFVAIDTWSTFIPVDTNSPHEVQAALSYLTHLAAKHDVCIIITHHMSKAATPSDLRKGIRGSTALVDGCRAAYVLHRVEADEAKEVNEALDMEGEVIRLGLVKNNLGLRRDAVTFVRQSDGCLLDVSARLGSRLSPEEALLQVIQEAHKVGQPLTKTGERGLYANRNPLWPAGVGKLSKAKLEGYANALVQSGRVEVVKGNLVPINLMHGGIA